MHIPRLILQKIITNTISELRVLSSNYSRYSGAPDEHVKMSLNK